MLDNDDHAFSLYIFFEPGHAKGLSKVTSGHAGELTKTGGGETI
jgi:hypothetical protein